MLFTVYFLVSDVHLAQKLTFSVFFISVIFGLGASATFHTLSCHSPHVSSIFNKYVAQNQVYLSHSSVNRVPTFLPMAPQGADLGGNWDQYKSTEKFIWGGGISGTTWATEMVHLLKFAEFHGNLNGNTFNIGTQLQIIINVKIVTLKCTFNEVYYTNRALRHVTTVLFSSYNLRPVGTLVKE